MQLFSQLVLGNGKHNMDIDRLTKMLEENRDLLNEMTQAEGSCSGDGAMLPKLLFELVEQAAAGQEGSEKSRSTTPTPTTEPEQEKEHELEPETSADQTDAIKQERRQLQQRRRRSHEPASAQEIIGNLPKVWKVLMELLSHHKIERVQFEEVPPTTTTTPTPTTTSASATTTDGCGAAVSGVFGAAAASAAGGVVPKSPELSVSKTYIKLKVSTACACSSVADNRAC